MRVLQLRGGPRLVAAGSSVLLAASGMMLASVVSAAPASAAVGQVAPYVDMSNSQEGVLDDTGWGGSGTQSQIWACSGNSNQSWSLP